MGKFEYYKDAYNQWRWRFKANNGKIIAISSEAYHNKQDCIDMIYLMVAEDRSFVMEEIQQ